MRISDWSADVCSSDLTAYAVVTWKYRFGITYSLTYWRPGSSQYLPGPRPMRLAWSSWSSPASMAATSLRVCSMCARACSTDSTSHGRFSTGLPPHHWEKPRGWLQASATWDQIGRAHV